MGYPSVKGRLHTRYSPVRHSHGSKLPIPFDLHVLGLPLAFILSQDQTLRCNIKVKYFPRSDVTQFFYLRLFLVLPFPNIFNELNCPKAIVYPLFYTTSCEAISNRIIQYLICFSGCKGNR